MACLSAEVSYTSVRRMNINLLSAVICACCMEVTHSHTNQVTGDWAKGNDILLYVLHLQCTHLKVINALLKEHLQ